MSQTDRMRIIGAETHNKMNAKAIYDLQQEVMEQAKRLTELEHGTIYERAAALIVRYGSVDGAHHKQWVLDQLLRILSGIAYNEMRTLLGDGWSEGIAP